MRNYYMHPIKANYMNKNVFPYSSGTPTVNSTSNQSKYFNEQLSRTASKNKEQPLDCKKSSCQNLKGCKKIPPPKNKKFDFKCLKNDTCKSLHEVEEFLCNFSCFIKYIKLYNLLK